VEVEKDVRIANVLKEVEKLYEMVGRLRDMAETVELILGDLLADLEDILNPEEDELPDDLPELKTEA